MRQLQSSLDTRLADTSDTYRRVCAEGRSGVFLYGAGFVGRWAVGYLDGIGIPVLGFVDSDEAKWGTYVAGQCVFSPTDPKVTAAKVLLITSRHAVPSIEKRLSHLPATIMSVDAFVVHHEGRERIDLVESLFAHDDHSLGTFRAVLLAMLEGNTSALGTFADNRPFFDRFGFFNRDGEVFVDAGAYVGDSLERFLWSVNGVFRHIHAFEPGRIQFNAMQKRVQRLVAEWALDPDSISLVNKGISSKSALGTISDTASPTQTTLLFDESPGPASNRSQIQTVSLDDYFGGDEFTLLKVDVEGSEAELLNGAAQSIAKHRPRIALSVYHFPVDIFDLPMRCVEANGDYALSLGHHSFKLMETVLYCRDKND